MMKDVKANVIVVRDEMVYMVQRVVANMEDKMLGQIFREKAIEGISKVAEINEADTIVSTSRFISVPVTLSIDDAVAEADITSVLASKLYDIISESYKVASVLVSTEACESIACIKEDGTITTIMNTKTEAANSFEKSITESL